MKKIIYLLCISLIVLPIKISAMEIYIKTTDKTLTLEVEPTMYIEEVKTLIYEQEDINVNQQILTFLGKELVEDNTLQDYSVQSNSTINLTLKEGYYLGQLIYLNPITLTLCNKTDTNCLAWNVLNETDTKLTLLAKDSIGKTSISNEESSTTYACTQHDQIMTYNEYECNILKEDPYYGIFTEWKEIEQKTYNNLTPLLDFIKDKTSTWNDNLILNKVYDDIDYTSYKARILTTEELNYIYDNFTESKYSFLLEDNPIVSYFSTKKWLSSYSNNNRFQYSIAFYKYNESPLRITKYSYDRSFSIVDIYPIIEIDKNDLKTYIININKKDNATININNNKHKKDDIINLDIDTNKGYIINNLTILDENNNKININNNSFIMPDSNIIINYDVTPIEYKLTSKNNQVYNNNDLIFTTDGDYTLVDKLYINDTLLDSSNYNIKEGSTIITLYKEYLSTLNNGTYKLTITYKNNTKVDTTFIINNLIDNPNTIDNTIYYILTLTISIILTLYISTLINKKILNTK